MRGSERENDHQSLNLRVTAPLGDRTDCEWVISLMWRQVDGWHGGGMLLILEDGAVRDLTRRHGVSFADPRLAQSVQASLVLHAAHTLLTEADVGGLTSVARDEVQAGLGGPLRTASAATAPSAEATLEALRDELVEALVASAGRVGALVLADRVHLSRLVLDEVPPIIAVACVCWYGVYRSANDPYGHQVEALHDLYSTWLNEPTARPHSEERMREAAKEVLDDHPENLISRPV